MTEENEKVILTDKVNRKKYLKKIGIDTDNLSEEIKNLYKKKLSLSSNHIAHGKFMAERTFREVILLQVAEKERIMEFDRAAQNSFMDGQLTECLDNQIFSLMKFLISL